MAAAPMKANRVIMGIMPRSWGQMEHQFRLSQLGSSALDFRYRVRSGMFKAMVAQKPVIAVTA